MSRSIEPCLCGDPGCGQCFGPFYPEQDTLDAAERFLEAVLKDLPDDGSGEVFTDCLVCGEWEGHTKACPVPVLKEWHTSQLAYDGPEEKGGEG